MLEDSRHLALLPHALFCDSDHVNILVHEGENIYPFLHDRDILFRSDTLISLDLILIFSISSSTTTLSSYPYRTERQA